jgi:hypothetical protein
MENVLQPPNILESSKRRKGPDHQTWTKPSKNSEGGPWRPNRRKLLIGTAAAGVGAILLGKRILDPQPSTSQPVESKPAPLNPYANWERFRNRSLSSEILVAIGQDLEKDTRYPGFAEAGRLIIQTQQNPDGLQAYLPQFEGHPALEVSLTNLLQRQNALANMETAAHSDGKVRVTEKNRQTGAVREYDLSKFVTVRHSVNLDNGIIFAPAAAKKLLLIKEFSHFLYYQKQKEHLERELGEKYEFEMPGIADVGALILLNGYDKLSTPSIPNLSDGFDNALLDIDGAGYYHIAAAFCQMKAEGQFSQTDLGVLDSNNRAYEAAKKAGLLLPKGGNKFEWKEGIGPFSPEWTKIFRPILLGDNSPIR